MKQLSPRNEELIHLLQINARESVSNLARKLGVSRTAVQERINRLQRSGVIQGYTVKLNPDWLEKQISAFIFMVVEPRHASRVRNALDKMLPIHALWTVSGRIDLIIMVRASTTAEIDNLLDDICALEGVTRTESSIILTSKLNRL